jgi:hypothetical protein
VATATFQQGLGGYTGSSDTMLRQSKPTNNLGASSVITVDGADSSGLPIQGLLRFGDIFGNGLGQVPGGAVITSATLTLNVTDGTSQPLSLYRMLTGWIEGSTWNSFVNGVQTDGIEAATTAEVTVASLGSGSRSIDVTQSVQDWANGGPNYGWAFLMTGSNGLGFSSSEGAVAPQLTVVYELPTSGLSVTQSDGSTSVTEGGQGDGITVALQTAPSANVTVSFNFGNDIGGTPAPLTFTPLNWNMAQTVTLSAVDDAFDEGTEVFSIALSSTSADTNYQGASASVSVTVNDNDQPPPPPPPGGGVQIYDTMVRESKPAQSFATTTSVNVDGSDGSGLRNQGLLSFQNLFGDSAGQVPVGAVIDSATLTLQVTDGTSQQVTFHRMLRDWAGLSSLSWNGLGNGIQTDGVEAMAAADVTLASMAGGTRNIDVTQSVRAWASGASNFGWAVLMNGSNGLDFTSSEGAVAPRLNVDWHIPTPGIAVSESGGSTVVTEGGSGDNLLIALSTAPTATVTVEVDGNPDLGISPASLFFTRTNWSTPQVLNLTAVDDTEQESTEVSTITLTSSSTDSAYVGRTATVGVTIRDNDSAPPPPPVQLSVEHQYDTTEWNLEDAFGCCDPSGIAYVPDLDLLFIADSEHDESPFFSQTNLFAVRPDGTYVDAYSMRSFTREPTGLAYNPHNGLLYISDDDADQIFWVNPANPGVKLGQIDLEHLGIEDGEDPEFDPDTGHMYVLDGVLTAMFELTADGDLVRVIDLPAEIRDAEGLAYDDARDVFYISSGATSGSIFEVGRDGNLIDTFTLLNNDAYRQPGGGAKPKLKGLELAPSSDPDDGNHMSLYAVDYGSDQVADGRMFELDLGPDTLLS